MISKIIDNLDIDLLQIRGLNFVKLIYLVMIVRQIYFEFVLPKLAETRRNNRENQRGK